MEYAFTQQTLTKRAFGYHCDKHHPDCSTLHCNCRGKFEHFCTERI